MLLAVSLVTASFIPLGSSAEDAHIGGVSLISMRGLSVKWGTPDFGTSAVIRYAFLDSAVARPGARNCRTMGPFSALLKKGGVDRQKAFAEIHKAFAAWQAVANVTFHHVDDPAQADVLVGTQAAPRGIAFADVAFDRPPRGALASIRQGAVCLNPDVTWETGFDGNEKTYDIRYVAMHEIGHVLGLDHALGKRPTIMGFKYREKFRAPQASDIAGMNLLYGPRRIPTAANVRAAQ